MPISQVNGSKDKAEEGGFTYNEAAIELGYTLNYLYQKVHRKEIVARKYGYRDALIYEADNADLFAHRRAFLKGKKPHRNQASA